MGDTGGGGKPEGGEGAQRGQGRGGKNTGSRQGHHDDSLIRKRQKKWKQSWTPQPIP
jgi:hypothetical protein